MSRLYNKAVSALELRVLSVAAIAVATIVSLVSLGAVKLWEVIMR